MKQSKQKLKTYFETGDKPTEGQYSDLIDSYVDSKQEKGDSNRRFVIDSEGEVVVASEQKIPEYSFSEVVNNTFSLLKDGVAIKEIDLTNYIDDTNLSRLISGSVAANGMAIFTRDDDSTFKVDFNNFLNTIESKIPEYTFSEITGNKLALLKDGVAVKEIDLSIYLDDTNLSRLVSGSVDVNGVATFTRDDNTTFTIDFSDLISPQVQANWNEIDNTKLNYIENKPVNLSDFNNDTDFITKKDIPEIQAGTNITIDNTDPLKPIVNQNNEFALLNSQNRFKEVNIFEKEMIVLTNGNDNLFNNNTIHNGLFTVNGGLNSNGVTTLSGNQNFSGKLTMSGIMNYDNVISNSVIDSENDNVIINKGWFNANIQQIQGGKNITIDNTDPLKPIINSSGGGDATDLSYTSSTDKGTIVSNNGTDAIIPVADKTNAGLMKANFYEEGNFTPTITALSASYTTLSTIASFVRVGNVVTFNMLLTGINTTGTPTQGITIEGLPFDGASGTDVINIGRFTNSNIDLSNEGKLIAWVDGGTKKRILFRSNLHNNASNTLFVFNSGLIFLSGTYITNIYTP